MSEEILAQESEETAEEEIIESSEQDSSDIEEIEEEYVDVTHEEILEYAASEGIEEDQVDEWIAENFTLVEEDDEEGDEEEDPVAEKKMSSKAKADAKKYAASAAGKAAIKKSKKKRSKPGYKVDPARAKKMAKSRAKGGISASVQIPKTKNQMLKNIYDSVNGMLKGDLATKYEDIMAATDLSIVKEEEEEEKEEKVRTKAAVKTEDIKIDVKDDVDALVQGEEGLTEDFKEKASTIFEAAVQAKVVEEVNSKMEELEAQLKSDASSESAEFAKELTEKVDGYLTYIVEEWMKENELAIERGIRTELVEDFMSGLKTLFTEHYIDLPEEKVDMVDDLFTKVEDLEGQLDEEINRGVELQKELSQFKKDDALRGATKDLADTETEKISKLAEGIEYENEEQYIEKLNVLKESYFPKSDAVTSEITEADETIEVSDERTEEKLNEDMQHYTSAIKRYNS